MSTDSTTQSKFKRRLRGAIPWLVGTVLLTWLFFKIPADEFFEATSRVSVPKLLGLLLGFVATVLIADGVGTWYTFRRCLPDSHVSLWEVIRIRAATYTLALLNYGVGQGGVAYFLNKRHAIPIATSAGAVLLTTGVNMILVAASASVGVLTGGTPTSELFQWIVFALAMGFPIYLLVIGLRPAFLINVGFLKPLFDAGVRGHLKISLARMPHLFCLLAGHYICMHLFGVEVPLEAALARLPLVFAAAVIPISPAGVGTSQLLAVTLFESFVNHPSEEVRQATVLAYSLVMQVGVLLPQGLLGFAFLVGLRKDRPAQSGTARGESQQAD